jgi:hypothetical protein
MVETKQHMSLFFVEYNYVIIPQDDDFYVGIHNTKIDICPKRTQTTFVADIKHFLVQCEMFIFVFVEEREVKGTVHI